MTPPAASQRAADETRAAQVAELVAIARRRAELGRLAADHRRAVTTGGAAPFHAVKTQKVANHG